MAGDRNRRSPSRFNRLLILSGLAVFAAVWIMNGVDAASDAYSWWALRGRGVDTTGVVASRTLKHCYGLACSSPAYFTGEVGSEDYRAFIDRCGRNSCQWFVDAEYRDRIGSRRFTQSVAMKDYEALAPHERVPIRFDPLKRDRAIIVGRTMMSSGSIAVLAVGGFAAVMALFLALIIRTARIRRRHEIDGRYWKGY